MGHNFSAIRTEHLRLPESFAGFHPDCADPRLRNDKRIGIGAIFKQEGRVNLTSGDLREGLSWCG